MYMRLPGEVGSPTPEEEEFGDEVGQWPDMHPAIEAPLPPPTPATLVIDIDSDYVGNIQVPQGRSFYRMRKFLKARA